MENTLDHKISTLPQEIILKIYQFAGINVIQDYLKQSKCSKSCPSNVKLWNLWNDPSLRTELRVTSQDYETCSKDFSSISKTICEGNFAFIRSLSITGWKIFTDQDLDFITSKLKNLKKINISNNPMLSNKGIQYLLKNLPKLNELNCSGFFVPTTKFDDEIFQYCLEHENIKTMNLFWCKNSISGEAVLNFVKQSKTIRKINIRHCSKLETLWDLAFHQFEEIPPIESLISIKIQNGKGNSAEILF